jgi:hypothetical protein
MTDTEFRKIVEDDFWVWVAKHDRPRVSWLNAMRMWAEMRFNEAYDEGKVTDG